eukprot:2967097-Prymnesium_polylepis.2
MLSRCGDPRSLRRASAARPALPSRREAAPPMRSRRLSRATISVRVCCVTAACVECLCPARDALCCLGTRAYNRKRVVSVRHDETVR